VVSAVDSQKRRDAGEGDPVVAADVAKAARASVFGRSDGEVEVAVDSGTVPAPPPWNGETGPVTCHRWSASSSDPPPRTEPPLTDALAATFTTGCAAMTS